MTAAGPICEAPRTPPPPSSSGRLSPLDTEALGPEARAVLDEVMAARGRLPTPYRVWIQSPELARHLYPLSQFLSRQTSLSKPEMEIAILCAARHWGAEYVLAVHAREAREAGLPEDIVEGLCAGRPIHPRDSRQRAIATLMKALEDRGSPPQPVFDETVARLGPQSIAELLVLAGYFTAVGLAMKLYAVEAPAR